MKKRLVLYLALSFTPAWVLWNVLNVLPLSVPMQTLGTALGMFSPMLAAMLTARLCGDRRIFPLHPHIHQNLPFYLLAWLGVPLLGLAGGTLYFACFPTQFDPHLSYFQSLLAQSGIPVADSRAQYTYLFSQCAAALIWGPFVNMFFAFGEELGWRGYLYPLLRRRLSDVQTALLGGMIWGVWHMPVLLRGHNYGTGYPGYPLTGILAMCVFCIAIGAVLFWLTTCSHSAWPAALAHGACNAAFSLPTLFLSADAAPHPLLGPMPCGLLSVIPTLLFALLLLTRCKPKYCVPRR